FGREPATDVRRRWPEGIAGNAAPIRGPRCRENDRLGQPVRGWTLTSNPTHTSRFSVALAQGRVLSLFALLIACLRIPSGPHPPRARGRTESICRKSTTRPPHPPLVHRSRTS